MAMNYVQLQPGSSLPTFLRGFDTKAACEAALWFSRRLMPEAEVYSDGFGAFRAAIDSDHAHKVINAGGGVWPRK